MVKRGGGVRRLRRDCVSFRETACHVGMHPASGIRHPAKELSKDEESRNGSALQGGVRAAKLRERRCITYGVFVEEMSRKP